MKSELLRDIPCSDPDCGTILGWPDELLCEDCLGAFAKADVPTENEQLTLDVEQEAA